MTEASEVSTTEAAPRNLVKTIVSVMWIYGGRGLGLLWTVVLIHQLGINDYGQYGMAVALNALVGPAVDNSFTVRAIRESEERFVGERTCRFLVAFTLIVLGLVLLPMIYVAGFGLTVAGGEMALNVVKSRSARDGHPDRVYRFDTARQVTSVAVASAYLYVAPSPTLLIASLLYCTPYAVILVLAALAAGRHRPMIPGPPRLIAALTGEMLGTAAYLQGDVLLLGALTNSTTVGYYTLTWVVSAAIAAVGQSFGLTYNEPLRESGGDLSAGPPLRNTLSIAGLGTTLVFVIGLGLLISPAPTELAVAMMIMSGFAGLRVVIFVFQVVLFTQRRDVFRLASAIGLVPFKLGLVAALSFAGAVGAAISSTVTDVVLLTLYTVVLYGPGRRRAPAQPVDD
jgi:O-antigen/teichoic acid export membrane protein